MYIHIPQGPWARPWALGRAAGLGPCSPMYSPSLLSAEAGCYISLYLSLYIYMPYWPRKGNLKISQIDCNVARLLADLRRLRTWYRLVLKDDGPGQDASWSIGSPLRSLWAKYSENHENLEIGDIWIFALCDTWEALGGCKILPRGV